MTRYLKFKRNIQLEGVIGIDKQLYQPNGVGLVLEGGAFSWSFHGWCTGLFHEKRTKTSLCSGSFCRSM